MSIEQPSSAPDAPDAITPRDADTAAVIRDTADETPPGGGGLGLRSADPGTPPHGITPHGTGPNAPVDTGLAAEAPAAEARHMATRTP